MKDYDALIKSSAQRYNIDPDVFRRLLIRESGLNASAINHNTGAAGIGQFMPATARGLGIDPMNPAQAIPASAQYVRQNLNHFGESYPHALAAYNWGPGNVAKHGIDNAPVETRNYIKGILGGGPMAEGGGGGDLPTPPIPPEAGPPPMPEAPMAPMAPMALGPDPQGSGLANAFVLAAKRANGMV